MMWTNKLGEGLSKEFRDVDDREGDFMYCTMTRDHRLCNGDKLGISVAIDGDRSKASSQDKSYWRGSKANTLWTVLASSHSRHGIFSMAQSGAVTDGPSRQPSQSPSIVMAASKMFRAP